MRRRAAKIALLLVIAGGVVAVYFSPAREFLTRDAIRAFSVRVQSVWYGPLVFIGAYGFGTIFALPASLFVITAGVIWGWKLGTLYAMAGAAIGATLSYYVGRFMGEGLLERFGRAGAFVARHVTNASFGSILIARLIPGPPFAVWNYVAGVARVPFGIYLSATLASALPGHIIFSYCADALFNGTMTEGDALRRILVVAALLITLVAGTSLLKRRYVGRASARP